MRNRFSRLFALCAATLTFGAALPAHADDTEIYIGQASATSNAARPNILFVMDTSGSMGTNVTTQTTFDPKQTYVGKCDPTTVFWRKSGFKGLPVDKLCNYRSNNISTVGAVQGAVFFCKTAQNVMDVSGFQTVNRTAQWKPNLTTPDNNIWSTLSRDRADQPIECKDDSDPALMSPPHGNGVRSYARNGKSGPWTDDAAQQINWTTADTQNTYTYFTGNYLNWYYNASSVTKTRLQIIQDSLRDVVSTLSQANVGLMRFSTDGEGGMVIKEMEDIATSRQKMLDAIDTLNASGNTPLSETYSEALRYWRGMKWDYGSRSSPTQSIAASRNDDTYISPIAESCQKNFIVLLTDGEPVSDQLSQTRIDEMTGFQQYLDGYDAPFKGKCTPHTSNVTETDGICLDDLAAFAHDKDQVTGASTPGAQTLTTYTVGFGADVQGVGWAIDTLEETAQKGGGQFFEAADTASLTDAFNNIIEEILSVNTTFTAPTVAVNAFNRTQNLDDLFITVFGTPQPPTDGNTFHWPGNVKKYEIQPNGLITGKGGMAVVNKDTGFFDDSAQDLWSDVVDGAEVKLGGAANEIPAWSSRKVYTDVSGGTLTAADNSVEQANTAITAAMLGIDATTPVALTREKLLDWVRGADIGAPVVPPATAPTRHEMGDPLHGRPATVIYGGTATNPDLVLFAVTNDGYLHAIEADGGTELWAYIPGPMLRRMKDLYEDKPQATKRYGLDGNIRVYKSDANNNGIVDGSDKVYLFFGEGRGGESYFALNVTDRNKPTLMWRKGSANEVKADGTPIPPGDVLRGLAQTWSTPVITNVKIGSALPRLVAIFAGGYDPTQDNLAYNTDDIGNRLYMLDAVTGAELWRGGPDTDSGANFKVPTGASVPAARQMNNSIPGDVRVIDTDGDQLADRMYVADTGARIWRFDIINGQSVDNLVRGGVFASLGRAGGTGTNPTDARRFYYTPDVSMIRQQDGSVFFNIAIGSGYRGHPLDEQIHDRFYSLRDRAPFTAKLQTDYDSFAYIQDTDTKLVDVTTNIAPTMPSDALGWKMDLSNPSWQGEKALAESITFANTVIFTTYLPQAGDELPNSNACIARNGQNRLYAVSAVDGSPVVNRDGSADASGNVSKTGDEVEDRWGDLNQTGIAPEAVILFPETSAPTCIVGVEACGVSFSNDPVRTFWYQRNTEGN